MNGNNLKYSDIRQQRESWKGCSFAFRQSIHSCAQTLRFNTNLRNTKCKFQTKHKLKIKNESVDFLAFSSAFRFFAASLSSFAFSAQILALRICFGPAFLLCWSRDHTERPYETKTLDWDKKSWFKILRSEVEEGKGKFLVHNVDFSTSELF